MVRVGRKLVRDLDAAHAGLGVGRQNAEDEGRFNLEAARSIARSSSFPHGRPQPGSSPILRSGPGRLGHPNNHLRDGAECIKLAARAVAEMHLAAPEADGNSIEFQDVSVRAGTSAMREIVSDVTLRIAGGETLVLLGRSGSGKTSLLKLINGLLIPSKGKILVKQKATTDWDRIALRRGIGYVIQEAGLFPHFTVAENVGLVPRLEGWPRPQIEARVGEMLRLVGLAPDEFGARRPRELSGGQRQRVGVARALAGDPPILLMDEPFGALDPVTRAELQREFRALAKQLRKTIVFVTHDLREALLLASRIVLLKAGRIVASAPRDEFLQLEHEEVRAFGASLSNQAGEPA
jgi:osmoprotectant transport system ATP-binding protein